MEPERFKSSNVVFAETQPEYRPLPAHRDASGVVTTCWKLTWPERIRVLLKGRLWLQQWTFNRALLQPILPSTGPVTLHEETEGKARAT